MALQRFVSASDFHGDRHEPVIADMFLAFVKDFMPHIRCFHGDLFDFRALRRGASIEEKSHSLDMDVSVGLTFLRSYRPHVLLRGNHDERLWDCLSTKSGLVHDTVHRGTRRVEEVCAEHDITMIPYDKRHGIYKLGDLHIMHGYGFGIGAVRKHAFSYGKSMIGHTHATSEAGVERLDGARCWETGCLCQLDQDYNRATMASLRHAHSWGYGWHNTKTGVTTPFRAVVLEDGSLFAPTLIGDDQ